MPANLDSAAVDTLRAILRLILHRHGASLSVEEREKVLEGFCVVGTSQEAEAADVALYHLRENRAAQLELRSIIEQLPPIVRRDGKADGR